MPLAGSLAAVLLSIATLAPAAAAASALPERTSDLMLGDAHGHPPGFPDDRLMARTPGAAGQVPFVPLLGVVGIDATRATWTSDAVSGATYAFVGDTRTVLEFAPVDVEVLASFTVELRALAPDGHGTLLAAAQRTFNLPRLVPATETFDLATGGALLPRGQALQLTVRADALDVLSLLQVGGTSGSGVHAHLRVSDRDLDGIPDDVDPCPLDPACPAQSAGGNATAIATYYTTYYNTTAGIGPPGAPGPAGPPGAGAGNGTIPIPQPPSPGDVPTPTPHQPNDAGAAAAHRIEPVSAAAVFGGASSLLLLGLLRRF